MHLETIAISTDQYRSATISHFHNHDSHITQLPSNYQPPVHLGDTDVSCCILMISNSLSINFWWGANIAPQEVELSSNECMTN